MNAERSAVLRQIASAQARFEDEEQSATLSGDLGVAEGARKFCRWLFRAYQAEFNDKVPPPPVMAACGACRVDKCDGCHFCRVAVLLS